MAKIMAVCKCFAKKPEEPGMDQMGGFDEGEFPPPGEEGFMPPGEEGFQQQW